MKNSTLLTKYKFQSRAIKNCVHHISQILEEDTLDVPLETRSLLLRAPTGAGKTIIAAQVLSQLFENPGRPPLLVIFLAPASLHTQSFDKFSTLFQTAGSARSPINCRKVGAPEDLTAEDGSVLFINWASVNKESNLLIAPNESYNNLPAMIQKARNKGIKIITIVDEAHMEDKEGNKAHEVIDAIINPDVKFGLSATFSRELQAKTYSYVETVAIESVIAEGLICESIVLNSPDSIEQSACALAETEITNQEILIRAAMLKAVQLKEAYIQNNYRGAPLIIIQVPNTKKGKEDRVIQELITHLESVYALKNGVSIAVKTADSSNPPGWDTISLENSLIRVLIFKVGIATGWDCPRAKILVGLRDMVSEILTEQVIGRIRRQPQGRAYPDELLNSCYVYLDEDRASLMEALTGLAKNESFPKGVVLSQTLSSQHPTLTGLPSSLFKYNSIKEHITQSPVTMRQVLEAVATILPAISDLPDRGEAEGSFIVGKSANAEDLVTSSEVVTIAKHKSLGDTYSDLRGLLFESVKASGFRGILAEDIVAKIEEALLVQDDRLSDEKAVQLISKIVNPQVKNQVLSELIKVMQLLKNIASTIAPGCVLKQGATPWVWPGTMTLKQRKDTKWSVLQLGPKHLFPKLSTLDYDSELETLFGNYLEKSEAVSVWLRNSENVQDLFKLPYLDNDLGLHQYIPDFIVKLNTGLVYVLDTKAAVDLTNELNVLKLQKLREYVTDMHSGGQTGVRGGFIVRENGIWFVNEGDEGHSSNLGIISAENGWHPLIF